MRIASSRQLSLRLLLKLALPWLRPRSGSACPFTRDVEHGLLAVPSVGYVTGNTAESPSVHLPHSRHLKNSVGQESVSGQRSEVRGCC